MSAKCVECGSHRTQEHAEMILEPFEGRVLKYGSRYYYCRNEKCKVTWYASDQMQEQLRNRTRALEAE